MKKSFLLRLTFFITLFVFSFFFFYGCDQNSNANNPDETDQPDPAKPDISPPSFEGAIDATASGYSAVTLTWEKAFDDVSLPEQIAYSAFVSIDDDPSGFDPDLPAKASVIGGSRLKVKDLSPDTDYFFIVRATDLSGKQEQNEVMVFAHTLPAPGNGCGGLGGGQLFKILSIAVVDETCTPVADSVVWINNAGDGPTSQTDVNGLAEFTFDQPQNDMVVSAGKAGFGNATFIDVSSKNITLVLPSLHDANDQGERFVTVPEKYLADIPQPRDLFGQDLLTAGIFTQAFTKHDLIKNGSRPILGPLKQVHFAGDLDIEISLPGNLWFPEIFTDQGTFVLDAKNDPCSVPFNENGPGRIGGFAFGLSAATLVNMYSGDINTLDIFAALAAPLPYKGAVLAADVFDAETNIELLLNSYLANFSATNPDPLHPIKLTATGLPSNGQGTQTTTVVAADFDGELVPWTVVSGEDATLWAGSSAGNFGRADLTAAVIVTVADDNSPLFGAYSVIIKSPDGGGEFGRLWAFDFLNFPVLLPPENQSRTFSWKTSKNGAAIDDLAIHEFTSDSGFVWTCHHPATRTQFTLPIAPAGIGDFFTDDNEALSWCLTCVDQRDFVWDDFSLESLAPLNDKASGACYSLGLR